jgi:hypothetical protein
MLVYGASRQALTLADRLGTTYAPFAAICTEDAASQAGEMSGIDTALASAGIRPSGTSRIAPVIPEFSPSWTCRKLLLHFRNSAT